MLIFSDVRKALHLTQAQIAQQLGLTVRQVSRYETGHPIPQTINLALETLLRRKGLFGEEQNDFFALKSAWRSFKDELPKPDQYVFCAWSDDNYRNWPASPSFFVPYSQLKEHEKENLSYWHPIEKPFFRIL